MLSVLFIFFVFGYCFIMPGGGLVIGAATTVVDKELKLALSPVFGKLREYFTFFLLLFLFFLAKFKTKEERNVLTFLKV